MNHQKLGVLKRDTKFNLKQHPANIRCNDHPVVSVTASPM